MASLVFGNVIAVGLKGVGEDVACTVLIEPMQLRGSAHENPSEHQTQHSLGMVLCIDERQG